MAKNNTRWKEILWLILLSPLLLLLGVLLLVVAAVWFPLNRVYEQWLKYCFWKRHGRFGRFVLFVYSDSPNWKEYIEQNILPAIKPHVVTLNWSKRKEWAKTNPFEAKIFHHWAGEREFNPIALLLPPDGKVKKVRFWQAFRDLKHGKDALLNEAEKVLFEEIKTYDTKAA